MALVTKLDMVSRTAESLVLPVEILERMSFRLIGYQTLIEAFETLVRSIFSRAGM